MTFPERLVLAGDRFLPEDQPACGTYAAYQGHHARGEYACADCREANRHYQSRLRVMNGTTKSRRVPIIVLRDLARTTRDPVTRVQLEAIIYDLPVPS